MRKFLIHLVRILIRSTNTPNIVLFYFKSKLLGIKYRSFPIISGSVFISGTGSITLGNQVSLSSGRRSNPLGGETKLMLISSAGATLKIGDNCGISNAVLFCTQNIELEENVLIGNGCKIYDSDFHPIHARDRVSHQKPVSAPVLIKKDAFVGAHSIILKGVTIGMRSVVGAGSVVTKSIPDNEVWAGNPARFIRKITDGGN